MKSQFTKLTGIWILAIWGVALCNSTPEGLTAQAADAVSQDRSDATESEPAYRSTVFKVHHLRRITCDYHALHLYQVLSKADSYLKGLLAASVNDSLEDNDAMHPLLAASVSCTEAMNNIKRITELFNEGDVEEAAQFEAYFLRLCNVFKSYGNNVKPRHLRRLGTSVKKFRDLVVKYFIDRRSLMTADEAELCKEMLSLCSRLRFCLLRTEYFDMPFIDLLTDALVFRPVEWVSEHKLAVAAMVIAAGLIYYFYIRPKSIASDSRGIRVEHGARQRPHQCAVYALTNALLLQAPDPEAARQRAATLDMNQLFQETRAQLEQIDAHDRLARFPVAPEGPELAGGRRAGLTGDELAAVMAEPVFMEKLKDLLGLPALDHRNIVIVEGGAEHLRNGTRQQYEAVSQAILSPDATAIYFTSAPDHLHEGHWAAFRRVNGGVRVMDSAAWMDWFVRTNQHLHDLVDLFQHPEQLPAYGGGQ
ncbi:hypothetical protein EBZ39_13845 [bacterium]|nr:hypothetical protein [bacterium]